MLITRFAPSPTGPLHLGHAYSAIVAHDMARQAKGRFLLRIEDIDQTRSRPRWETQIYEDLAWLGIRWDDSPVRQSDRITSYVDALKQLWSRGFVYPCHCRRKDILAAASAPQEGVEPAYGPDGLVYPGTCRPSGLGGLGEMPTDTVLRLNMHRALAECDDLSFTEIGPLGYKTGQNIGISRTELVDCVGDIILSRKDFAGSYHLSVVLDDAAQGITHVIRGQDLFEATKIHVVLQQLLGLPTPVYLHHPLIRDENGKRLAKRDDARAISKYRDDGVTAGEIRKMVGL
ncbi:tRNA glutamyl-Q(34) synthetase GluQRS [Pelagimonas varians]|uniref:Glutamate--tRNA ligase n=1 Tax=Pelagimonas varians TaxID=696760 RepID=A0A238JQ29_9RHOB|nr:tRNA glutamyl-Q(34) synthetase GluQRS [Pelagimonas varians]PYG34706.1 glutamyl-Q tRNA(Asp) synthetase [Pelagimonas varians]SMX32769.1 Glutamate--tRNA ligase [Pelagimonas varians]